MADYNIAANADDWYSDSGAGAVAGTTTLLCSNNNAIVPPVTDTSVGEIDTSGIPDTDVISAATLYFYVHSYTVTGKPAPTKYYQVWMLSLDDTTNYYIGDGIVSAAGWYSIALPSARFADINKTGKTQMSLITTSPGDGKSRLMQIRAKEYAGTYSMYLSVTHAAPSTGSPKQMSLCPSLVRFGDEDENMLMRGLN